MLRKSHLLLLYQWNSTVKVSWQLIAQETLQCYFLSNVSIRILGSCKFQLYVKFYSVTISIHNSLLLSHFYISIQKIGITRPQRFRKLFLPLSKSRYTEDLLFFLAFHIWNVFCYLFHSSICMSCLLPGRPVIFTSCHLYFSHIVEYWAMT